MERIIVKGFKKCPSAKGNLMVVEINGNRKATLAPWEKKEQTFIEDEVGELGNFEGDIVTDGDYTNIKNIKFDSAKKSDVADPVISNPVDPVTDSAPCKQNVTEAVKMRPLRDDSIVAQVFVKGAVEMYCFETGTIENREEFLSECIQDLHKAYKLGVGLLEQWG